MANAKKIKIGETTYDFKDQAASTSINSLTSRVSSLETNVNNLQEDKLDADFNSNGYLGIADITSTLDYMIDKGTTQATITIGKIGTDAAYCTRYLCNGTNDKEVFQDAIDALPTNGGKIAILDGEYEINQQLVCNKNVIFEGMGIGSTIIKYNGANNDTNAGLFNNTTGTIDVVFRDIEFNVSGYLRNGPTPSTVEYLIDGSGNSKLLIDNCAIITDSGSTINVKYDSESIIYGFDLINIINSEFNLHITGSRSYGVSCMSCIGKYTGVKISNCSINVSLVDIEDFHFFPSLSSDSLYESNYISNSYITIKNDASSGGMSADLGDNNKINNCRIDITGKSGNTIEFGNCQHYGRSTFINCYIRNYGGSLHLAANKIIGCTLITYRSIYIVPSANTNLCIITNNCISLSPSYNISCYRESTNIIFTNNMINKNITSIDNATPSSVIKDNIYTTITTNMS